MNFRKKLVAFFLSFSNFKFHLILVEFQAYDQHLNMILGDVEEVVTTVEIDDETYEEIVRVCLLFLGFLFFFFDTQFTNIFLHCLFPHLPLG